MNIAIRILGILAIAYFILVNLFFGGTTFSWFYLVLGLGLILYSIYINKLLGIASVAKFVKPLRVIISIGLIVFIGLEAVIICYPKKETNVSDYIVVLGAGIRGENLSLTLKDRLDASLELANKIGFKGKFVVSGGKGPNEDITEAEAMRRYLESKGIPNNRILIEDKATSTFENFKYSKEIINKDTNIDVKDLSIAVVTTDFHGFRSNILAERNGYEDISLYTAQSEWYLIPSAYAREFFAFGKSFIFDR